MRVLSLGAGVQSSAVLLMMREGDLPPADAAIFADTGWEPKAVYDWLEYLEGISPVPVYRVSKGNLRADALNPSHRVASMPLYVRSEGGRQGMLRRQCTSEYKIKPVRKKVRALLKESGERTAEMWFGISVDEYQRMREPDVRYISRNVYPLVERRMTRHDCLRWLYSHGYPPPPRSACIGCPFRRNHEWRDIKAVPEEWADAVGFDKAIRSSDGVHRAGARGHVYLHRSLQPLDEVDLSTEEERGQGSFLNECEGMCGT